MSGMPLLRSAYQRAVRLMESKADLMSRNATFTGRLNSRCSSDRNRRARIASAALFQIFVSYVKNC